MYVYKVKQKTEMYSYSDDFLTEEDALKWYNKKGMKIEKLTGRKLILKKKKTPLIVRVPMDKKEKYITKLLNTKTSSIVYSVSLIHKKHLTKSKRFNELNSAIKYRDKLLLDYKI